MKFTRCLVILLFYPDTCKSSHWIFPCLMPPFGRAAIDIEAKPADERAVAQGRKIKLLTEIIINLV